VKRLVILESPFAGRGDTDVARCIDADHNLHYARDCVRDSLMRGESPSASHLLYTQPGILDDANPKEREAGISAGLAWGDVSHGTVVYVDRGITGGMRQGIKRALEGDRHVDIRSIAGNAHACVAALDLVRDLYAEIKRVTSPIAREHWVIHHTSVDCTWDCDMGVA
jgi:hypothetical protein